MAKREKSQSPAPEAPVVVVAAPAVKRLPFQEARAANFAHAPNPDALAPAGVVQTAKGTNPVKARVYGYDNGEGKGVVPKGRTIALVPGMTGTPRGVTEGQWAALQGFVGATVQAAYDSKTVASRTVRRAYRAGYIRFVG